MNKIELQNHQIKDYNAICEGFKNNKMLIYVTATGNGKSYITGKYIQDNDLKALIITPTISISRQWNDIVDCDCITYQKLYRCSDENLRLISSKYDFFVIDEAHHAGAPAWGKSIIKIKNIIKDKKMLGLTANPIRYSDCSSDIITDIFDNIIVHGKNLSQSINAGILPRYDFITAFYENPYKISDKRLEELSDEDRSYAGRLIHRLDMEINENKLKEIVYNHLPDDRRKIVVFVPDIKSIDRFQKFLDFCFSEKDYKSFIISSHESQMSNEKVMKEFECCTNKISTLLAVDMLNEGRHISGVNTIFMFRQTKSPQIYLQQIGRSMSASNKTSKVVIYDFVRNNDAIEYKLKNTTDRDGFNKYDISSDYIIHSDQCIEYSYTEECIDMLMKLEKLYLCCNPWTEEEKSILEEKYPEYGSKTTQFLPGRTKSSIMAQARKNKIHYSSNQKEKEKDRIPENDKILIVKKYFPEEGVSMYTRIEGMTPSECLKIANELGLIDKKGGDKK